MSTWDVTLYWILALPAVVAFYLAYDLIEDMIKKAWTWKRPLEPPKWVHSSPIDRLKAEADQTPQFRGYDSSEVFREDTLIRLQAIYKQVTQHNQNIEDILAEMRCRMRSS